MASGAIAGFGGVASFASAQTWTSDAPTARDEPAEWSHWRLHSDATFAAYAVASTLTPVVWERRRLVETLALDHVLRLGPDSREPRYRLRTTIDLRLDQDFGRDCLTTTEEPCFRVTEPADVFTYQPLARPSRLDVPAFSVELTGPRGMAIRAGRQLQLDPAGMFRFDGLRARLQPLRWLTLEVLGGRQVRTGSFAGSTGLAPQGSIHVVLPEGFAPSRAPAIVSPSRTFVGGASLAVGTVRYAQARAFFREQRDQDGLVLRFVGAGLSSQPLTAIGLRGDVVWELGKAELVEALGELTATGWGAVGRLRVRHHVPRFDLGSIWSFFDPVPVSQLELVLEAPPWRGRLGEARVGGALRGRRSKPSQADQAQVERDAGAELYAQYERGPFELELRGFLWAGSLAPVAAILAELARGIGRRGRAWVRLGVWRFDDTWRSERYATSGSIAMGTSMWLSQASRFALDIEWSHGRLVRHRVRALASFLLRRWM